MTKTVLKRTLPRVTLICFLLLLFSGNLLSYAVEKADKKPRRSSTLKGKVTVSDATLTEALKQANDLLKKKDYEAALQLYGKIHQYATDVLSLIKPFRTRFEKRLNDPALPITEREELVIKLKTLSQMGPKYERARNVSVFALGQLYAKKGDAEKAKKYLFETMDLYPYSPDPESEWTTAKTLLLDLFQLEGAF